jgi:hypothetical protein
MSPRGTRGWLRKQAAPLLVGYPKIVHGVMANAVHGSLNTVGVLGAESCVEKESRKLALGLESALHAASTFVLIMRRESYRVFPILCADEVQRAFVLHS